jgi:hypothetical protein
MTITPPGPTNRVFPLFCGDGEWIPEPALLTGFPSIAGLALPGGAGSASITGAAIRHPRTPVEEGGC